MNAAFPTLPREVAFHFNATDKLQYACRLLRKAFGQGAHLHVLADASLAERLDMELWVRNPGDFLPHCTDAGSEAMLLRSPVVMGPSVMSVPSGLASQSMLVLVNLSEELPDITRMGRYQRVIEVVSTSPRDRELARDRWRSYRQLGLEPLRHDLGARST